jgi:hypothetical protein
MVRVRRIANCESRVANCMSTNYTNCTNETADSNGPAPVAATPGSLRPRPQQQPRKGKPPSRPATDYWLLATQRDVVLDNDRIVLRKREVVPDKNRIFPGKSWGSLDPNRVFFVEIVPSWSVLDRSKKRKACYEKQI